MRRDLIYRNIDSPWSDMPRTVFQNHNVTLGDGGLDENSVLFFCRSSAVNEDSPHTNTCSI